MSTELQAIIVQKSPATDFDQEIDWTCDFRNLGNDTIVSSTWSAVGADSALILSDPTIGSPATNTTIWLSGGTLGNTYIVTNTVVTSGARTLPTSFIVQMVPNIYLTNPSCI